MEMHACMHACAYIDGQAGGRIGINLLECLIVWLINAIMKAKPSASAVRLL
jgi:hypothetical protein